MVPVSNNDLMHSSLHSNLTNENTFKKAIRKGEDGEAPTEKARQRRVLLIHKIIENEENCCTRMKIRIRFFISRYIYKNE